MRRAKLGKPDRRCVGKHRIWALSPTQGGRPIADINASPESRLTAPIGNRFSLTLRKPAAASLTLQDLDAGGFFETVVRTAPELRPDEAELIALRDAGDWPRFLAAAVRSRRNILVSGATGSGKTTLAKALVRLVPAHERILTIEDARELVVPQRNVVHMLFAKDGQGLAQVGPKQLLESALRMRPDRILLQELRDATAFYYLRNVNTGHPGSITTLHADSAELAFEQLTLLVKENDGGRDLTRQDIRALLHLLVDVVVQVKRSDGRFRVTEIWYEPRRQRTLACCQDPRRAAASSRMASTLPSTAP